MTQPTATVVSHHGSFYSFTSVGLSQILANVRYMGLLILYNSQSTQTPRLNYNEFTKRSMKPWQVMEGENKDETKDGETFHEGNGAQTTVGKNGLGS